MRNRINKAIKVVNVTTSGMMTTFNVGIPTTNLRGVRDKVKSLSPEYAKISENVSKKVEEFRKTQAENKRLKKLVNTNALRTVDRMFNNLIETAPVF